MRHVILDPPLGRPQQRGGDPAIHKVRRRLAPAARHSAFLARCGDQPCAARAAPRIALRLTSSPVGDAGRLAGTGSLEQILDDLGEVRRLGAGTVVLDPYHGDPEETRRPERGLARAHHRSHPLEDSIVITPADQTLLRRAIAIAARAITADSVRVALALGMAWHRAQNVQF